MDSTLSAENFESTKAALLKILEDSTQSAARGLYELPYELPHSPESGKVKKILGQGITMNSSVLEENPQLKELALEVFGAIMPLHDRSVFLPIQIQAMPEWLNGINRYEKSDLNSVLPQVSFYSTLIGGSIYNMVDTYGASVFLDNIKASIAGGAVMKPGLLPVLGVMGVSLAVGGITLMAPGLIKKGSQNMIDLLNGDERKIAINAVKGFTFEMINSTKRSPELNGLKVGLDEIRDSSALAIALRFQAGIAKNSASTKSDEENTPVNSVLRPKN